MYRVIKDGKYARREKFTCYVCGCLYMCDRSDTALVHHHTKDDGGVVTTVSNLESQCPQCRVTNVKVIDSDVVAGAESGE